MIFIEFSQQGEENHLTLVVPGSQTEFYLVFTELFTYFQGVIFYSFLERCLFRSHRGFYLVPTEVFTWFLDRIHLVPTRVLGGFESFVTWFSVRFLPGSHRGYYLVFQRGFCSASCLLILSGFPRISQRDNPSSKAKRPA